MIDFEALALKANQALVDGEPLVLETAEEKIAVRSYAEREYSWVREYGDSAS